MFELITGGSGSGKSAYAENRVLSVGAGRRIYIATMLPYGEDGRQRVERHRKLREKKQFETIECYTNLKSLSLPSDGIVLLECMSNLVANEVFELDGAGERTIEEAMRGIEALRRQARHLFVVTNEVFSDGVAYDAETMRYLSFLGAVNQKMAEQADVVTEVVYGIPVSVRQAGD
ncbi:MAG: bifunctional adenosylcobinamide kinase/adenosylcobinamide-phosphate guanylyltransferase [Lachnospiraceae bacterium]|nr:bifunctional adenosylcobinamide kinase/adenosylcobinamide-phosphate guanylyltransferase [Lachnospiraceae bacterium]